MSGGGGGGGRQNTGLEACSMPPLAMQTHIQHARWLQQVQRPTLRSVNHTCAPPAFFAAPRSQCHPCPQHRHVQHLPPCRGAPLHVAAAAHPLPALLAPCHEAALPWGAPLPVRGAISQQVTAQISARAGASSMLILIKQGILSAYQLLLLAVRPHFLLLPCFAYPPSPFLHWQLTTDTLLASKLLALDIVCRAAITVEHVITVAWGKLAAAKWRQGRAFQRRWMRMCVGMAGRQVALSPLLPMLQRLLASGLWPPHHVDGIMQHIAYADCMQKRRQAPA
jgi:hypothetical protein